MKLYLASPYSHHDEQVRELRFRAACKAAGRLMLQGHIVFSPISHSHPISLDMDNSLEHEFWLKQDESFLEWCDKMLILDLPGWNRSTGVKAEIEWCKAHGKPWGFYKE